MAGSGEPGEESIGELVGRLADDGRAFVRAEVALYRSIAARRIGRAKGGLIALLIGAVLLFAAFIALLFGLVLWLATLIGPLLAGLAVAGAFLLVGFVLIRIGLGGLKALGGDEAEREALARGDDLA